jgi:hypothetical protein
VTGDAGTQWHCAAHVTEGVPGDYLDLIYDGFHDGLKVPNFPCDDACVFEQLRHKRHMPDSCRHDNEELLVIQAIGARLIVPLVNQLADDLTNALDRYPIKRSHEFGPFGGIFEGS